MSGWLPIALWGGVAGLDATSFPQVMVSRPLVAAVVTGLLLGRPDDAIVLGLLLEVFTLMVLPVGATRYPDTGPATVAATAAWLGMDGPQTAPSLLLLALVFALLWERVAGWTVHWVRGLNGRLLEQVGGAAALERIHVLALAIDFARATAVTVIGFGVGGALLRLARPIWTMPTGLSLGVVVVAGTAVLAGAFPLLGGWSRRKLAFTVGILCGLLILLLR